MKPTMRGLYSQFRGLTATRLAGAAAPTRPRLAQRQERRRRKGGGRGGQQGWLVRDRQGLQVGGQHGLLARGQQELQDGGQQLPHSGGQVQLQRGGTARAASVGAVSGADGEGTAAVGERAAVVEEVADGAATAAPDGVATEVRDRALARPAGAVEATAGAEESAARAAETTDGVARAAGEAGSEGDAVVPPQPHDEVPPAPPRPTPMQAEALIEGQEETARTGNPETAPIHTPHLLTHSPPGAPTLCPHPHRHSRELSGAAKARAFLEEPCSPTINSQPSLPLLPPGPPSPGDVHMSEAFGPVASTPAPTPLRPTATLQANAAQLRGLEGELRLVRQPHATQPHGPAVLHSSLVGQGHPPSLTDLEASEPSSGLGVAVSDLLAIQNTGIPLPTPTPPAPVVHAHEAPLMDLPLAAPILQEPFHPSPMETDLIFRPSEGTAMTDPTDTATSPDEVVRGTRPYSPLGGSTDAPTGSGDTARAFKHGRHCSAHHPFWTSLLAVYQLWLRGYYAPAARSLLASSTLVALAKPNLDVRPIAIGEVLIRILSRAVCLQLRDQMARVFLASQQFGVGVTCGTEVVVRGVCHALDDHPDWVVLQLDMANAFNSFHRDAMFQALYTSAEFHYLIPFIRLFYGTPSDLLYRANGGVTTIHSERGTGVSRVLEAWALESVRARHTNPLHLARLTSLQGAGAGAWLTVVLYADSLRIPEAQWQVASAFRLGLPITQLALAGRCSCGQAIDDMTVPHHVVRCSRFGVATVIHDTVKYMLRDFASEAGFAVKVEDTTLILHLEAARARLQGLSGTGDGVPGQGGGTAAAAAAAAATAAARPAGAGGADP
ncbi:unnamed protein product [Closterium sp. NIES-64]|nr:unnamed protein product [Closterium sp. NIES-64]